MMHKYLGIDLCVLYLGIDFALCYTYIAEYDRQRRVTHLAEKTPAQKRAQKRKQGDETACLCTVKKSSPAVISAKKEKRLRRSP